MHPNNYKDDLVQRNIALLERTSGSFEVTQEVTENALVVYFGFRH